MESSINQVVTVAEHIASIIYSLNLFPTPGSSSRESEQQTAIGEIIRRKYALRELLQINSAIDSPITAIPVYPDEKGNLPPRTDGLFAIMGWYQRHLDCRFVVIDGGPLLNSLISQNPEGANARADMPFAPDVQIELSPYFSNGQDAITSEPKGVTYSGVRAPAAENAKDKGFFSNRVFEIGNCGDPYSNFAIPTEEIAFRQTEEAPFEAMRDRIMQIVQMKKEIAARAVSADQKALIESSPEGIVLRPSKKDGGFGNVFISRDLTAETEPWQIKNDGVTMRFNSLEELLGFLKNDENMTFMVEGWDYVMSRMVDVEATPSIGVHFDDDQMHVMIPTVQVQDQSHTTVGGGSANIGGELFNQLLQREVGNDGQTVKDIMQRGATQATLVLFGDGERINQVRGRAHVGYDWILSGEKEMAMIEVLRSNPDLESEYGKELSPLFTIECNPRHTLISGVTGNLARAVRWSRGEDSLAVERRDITALYDGSAAFFVHDFVSIPDSFFSDSLSDDMVKYASLAESADPAAAEEANQLLRRISASLNEKFIEYVETFNRINRGRMVMIPRIDVYSKYSNKGMKFICSIAAASVSQEDDDQAANNRAALEEFMMQMQQGGDPIWKLPDIAEELTTVDI